MIGVFVPPPHVHVQLAGVRAGRRARAALGELLAALDGDDLRERAILAASEIVTNAVAAAGECTMSAWFLPERRMIRLEVQDASSGDPVVQPLDSHRIGGHGLRIVEHLSRRWGIDRFPGGKSVWVELDDQS